MFHHDLYGMRENKYEFLMNNDLSQANFKELELAAPQYFFVPKDFKTQESYEKGFSIENLFRVFSTGVKTHRDHFVIDFDADVLAKRIKRFFDANVSIEEICSEMKLKDTKDWSVIKARRASFSSENITNVHYRPLDVRAIYYDSDLIDRGRFGVMQHFLKGENIGLITSRITKEDFSVLCTKYITAHKSATVYDISYVFPLYCHSDIGEQTLDNKQAHEPNLDPDIVKTIADRLSLHFTPEKEDDNNTFAPIDLLDYIYAVLHSPAYRQHYNEFLKTDFPRVPYPTDKNQFRKLVTLGSELRTLHLLESPTLNTLITGYPQTGDNTITKPEYKITDTKNRLGKVHINQTQYFTDVPEAAWNFHIGGYQPAQKWLKDRKGRTLDHNDITHYQKTIVVLTETDRLMGEIDAVRG